MSQVVLDYLNAHHDAAIARLLDLLRIPSVSTDPLHKTDMERACRFLARELQDIGLAVEVCPTPGHPVLLAKTADEDVAIPPRPVAPRRRGEGKPPQGGAGEGSSISPEKSKTPLSRAVPMDRDGLPSPRSEQRGEGETKPLRVLFYGHYDVQPAEPLDLWETPPFEPAIRNGAIYARGACDDKGQVMTFIEALRAWKQTTGKFPVAVTMLLEGEEEIGSANLRPLLEARANYFAADVALISDTGMWDQPEDRGGPLPALTYGLRGLAYFDVQLHGPNRDLHSGVYGGTLANPAVILTQVLARLFDENCRITVDGFYDDVLPLTAEERENWQELGNIDSSFLGPVGVKPYGEAGFSTLERRWARPTCDINGLFGGYGGAGSKTIIPSFAGAKVSFRLVPDQNTDKIAAAFQQWLTRQEVHGCTWKITDLGGGDPVIVPIDSPFVRAAQKALTQAAGKKSVLIREGGTLPVVSEFKQRLGLDTLLVGFGLNDDRVHSPNEKFDIECFRLGYRTHALLLAELANAR